MNLFPFQIAVEALGWCFIALAFAKASAKPKCPTISISTPRAIGIVVAVLVLSTSTTVYFAIVGNGLASSLAFVAYALAWLRFEAHYDAKKAPGYNRGRYLVRR